MLSAHAAHCPSLGRRSGLIVALMLVFLAIVPATASATALPATISENMTLTAAGSPYTGSSVTISEGVTVAAEPGALIKLTGTLMVKGTLDVNGTAEEPVVFTSSSDSAPGQWTGISLQAGAGASNLSHAEIRYAKTGIAVSGGISPTIEHSFIHHGTEVGLSVSGPAPVIANNEVSDNTSTGISMSATGSGASLHDNLVERNGAGISASFNGATPASFSGNDANDNKGFGISVTGSHLPSDLTENSLSGNKRNAISVGGTVAKSATWKDNGSPIVIWSSSKIPSGSTLTLEPGLVLKSEGTNTLTVEGTLDAEGTEADPIIFTSNKDDSHGGDTNGNGSANQPAVGDWTGLIFSSGSVASPDHIEVAYAGFKQSPITVKSGANFPSFTNSEIHHGPSGWFSLEFQGSHSPAIEHNFIHDNWGGIAVSGSAPVIANNEVSDNTSTGISMSATGSGASLHDNLVERNGGAGIVASFNGATPASFSGNEVNDNKSIAISVTGSHLPPDITENSLSGNTRNAVSVGGTVAQSATWKDNGFPVVIWSTSKIPSATTLTLDPGLVVKVESGNILTVEGTLDADGTEADPIIFTSYKDDSHGGDTNGNGSANQPAAGDWGGLSFYSSSVASPSHVEVAYAGNKQPSIQVKSGASFPSLMSSEIHHSATGWFPIEFQGSHSPVIEHNFIHHNFGGLHLPGGAPVIANNEISDNTNAAISYSSASGQASIHDNLIERNYSGISASFNGTSPASFTDNEVNNNGTAILIGGSNLPPDLTENSLSGNTKNGLFVYGTVSKSTTWKDNGFPIAAWSTIKIPSGSTLTLDPGLVVKMESSNSLTVEGTLDAEGTGTEPIIFTSIQDDSHGGDTNGNGSATQPAAGDWRTFWFEPNAGNETGGSAFQHVKFLYGGRPNYPFDPALVVECPCPNPPRFLNVEIRHIYSTALRVEGDPGSTVDGKPIISRSRFRDIPGNGISKSGTKDMWAPYNDYGCATGPAPNGCGVSVSSKVNWAPLESEEGDCFGKATNNCRHGADPVALSTGAFTYSHRDLRLTSKTLPLEFARSYNSDDPSDAGLGVGWSHNGLISAMALETGDVIVRHPDGRTDLFREVEGNYVPPSGVTDSLTLVEGSFRLTKLDQSIYDFRSDGRIASITDDHGFKASYSYVGGRLASITDPSSQTLTFSYDSSNHITKVTDSTGREVKYSYSAAGDLKSATDALGGVTEYSYDSDHRIMSIKDPRENVILQNTYDGQGRVTEQLDGLENLWTLDYEEGKTVVTDPEGGEIAYAFDEQGRVVSETDQLGDTTTTSYNPSGYVDEIVRPGGAKWEFGYDAAGNLTSVIDPEEGERSYEYDAQNRLISFTDAREETWTYEWSEGNDLEKVIDPDEGEATLTYNAFGQPLTITDPNEHTTTFTYDGRGNRLTVEDALEHTTSFDYDSRNYLTSKTEPGLEPEEVGRNALGDVLSRTTPEGHTTQYDYDANGMLVQLTDPAEGIWEIERNAMGRPTAYIDPLEQSTAIEYDGNLNPIEFVDRRGKKTTYGYDLANQLIGIEAPEGGDWEFDYDGRGNRTSIVDPRGKETTFEFDLLDRMTEVAEPMEATTSYGYDPAGNMTSFTDPRESTTTLVYDELGRLTDIQQPLEKTTSFSYDGGGNLLSRTSAAGTLEYEYDAADRLQWVGNLSTTLRSFGYDLANRLTTAVDAQNDEIQIGYDDDDNLISLDDGRGQTVTRDFDSRGNLVEQVDGRGTLEYGYDKLNRLTSLVDPQAEALGFSYDAEGNPTTVELPNGVVTTNAYDDAGRLVETTSEAPEETVLESFEYDYDETGNRIGSVDRLAQETTYAYDDLNRLVEFNPPGEGATTYDYDVAGNRIEAGGTTYSFNALNQLTSASDGTTYDYDEAGRLTKVANGEQVSTYGWNLFEEMTQVDDGSQEVIYEYDAFGRRSERNAGAATLTHYGDLTDRPIIDTDAEGKVVSSYVSGPLGLVEQSEGEVTSFPLSDAHGDITAVTDEEVGIVSRQSFDPWGAQLSGPELEMGYLGAQQRRSDPATGLVQMGVRPYSPAMGSFISEDPILGHLGFGASLNRYAYVWDNPLLYFDLTGRSILGDTVDAIANAAEPVVNGAGRAIDDAWDSTANERTAVGIAGDGNGGSLSEVPGVVGGTPNFVSERGQDLVKSINLSTEELIAAGATSLGTTAICGVAVIGASAAGTPAAGVAAGALCATIEGVGTVETVNDVFDDENGLPTDELFE